MQKQLQKKQKLILLFASLLALLLHAGFIYILYDSAMPMGFYPLSKNSYLSSVPNRKEEEGKKDRKVALAEIFTKIQKVPTLLPGKENLADLSPEFAPPPVVFFANIPLELQENSAAKLNRDLPIVILEEAKNIKLEIPEMELSLALPFPANLLLGELEKAALGLQGEIPCMEEELAATGLQYGIEEHLPDIGEDFFSTSGFLSEQKAEATSCHALCNNGQLINQIGPKGGLPEICPPPLADSLPLPAPKEGAFPASDCFDIAIEYSPKRSRPGYVFKITLSPKKDLSFKRITQNFFFLLDRSNSIARYRYQKMRRAVSEVLTLLQPGDTFNILVFEAKVAALSPENLPWSHENVAKARLFLERQSHGGMFATTDLYASLGKIIPKAVIDTEINTAVLLSDGDTFLSLDKQRKMIGSWTEQNAGKVSLFSIATGVGNNLPLLELLSTFNKGKLFYAPEHDLIKERLFQLMKLIKNPIGKSITLTAVTLDKKSTILLQPKNSRLPDLYQDRPFIIYGSTNRLSDFTLFLQGQYYDSTFDIKKLISFKEARGGTLSLEREWTQLLAQEFFERYFKDGKEKHLESAKQLLSPLNLPIPFLKR